jgi:hypothetical protein
MAQGALADRRLWRRRRARWAFLYADVVEVVVVDPRIMPAITVPITAILAARPRRGSGHGRRGRQRPGWAPRPRHCRAVRTAPAPLGRGPGRPTARLGPDRPPRPRRPIPAAVAASPGTTPSATRHSLISSGIPRAGGGDKTPSSSGESHAQPECRRLGRAGAAVAAGACLPTGSASVPELGGAARLTRS